LDPNQKHAVRGLIRDIASTKTIVISTHLLEEGEAVCSRAVIIDRGRLVADGTPAELSRRAATGKLDDVFRNLTSHEETVA
jgi:ABC-2 type transport system ATP-binding protein